MTNYDSNGSSQYGYQQQNQPGYGQQYGYEQPQGYGQQQPPASQTPNYTESLVALLCGIGSIVFSGTLVLGVGGGIAAIIFGKKAERIAPQYNVGMWKTGRILGIVGIVLSSLALVFFAILIIVNIIAAIAMGSPNY